MVNFGEKVLGNKDVTEFEVTMRLLVAWFCEVVFFRGLEFE